MHCPTPAELLPRSSEKSGWPWSIETPPWTIDQRDAASYPKISIITPSYNQGEFIEETIRSVLLQGYPNLEYIIIDGGSTDNSVEIIRKYEPWLAYWQSELDRGQADAINKGIARASGEILSWLNSDDIYEPGALHEVAKYFFENLECQFMYGTGWYLNEDGSRQRRFHATRSFDRTLLMTKDYILQPAAFWRYSLWQAAGPLDISLHWGLDWDWFIRATSLTAPHFVEIDLAGYRLTDEIKSLSGGQRRRAELAAISRRHGGWRQPTNLVYQLDRCANWMDMRFGRTGWRRIPQYPLTAVRLAAHRIFGRVAMT
jgi:glycosyltransferase involved in cell wall biosynthesis